MAHNRLASQNNLTTWVARQLIAGGEDQSVT